MNDVVAALLLALAAENADLREQLASAQDMLVETAIDAGNMYALVEAMQSECDAWREEALRKPRQRMALGERLLGHLLATRPDLTAVGAVQRRDAGLIA